MTHPAPAHPGQTAWKQRLAEIRRHRREMRQVARALGLNPDSSKGTVVWEFLLARRFSEAAAPGVLRKKAAEELLRLLKIDPARSTARRRTGTHKGLLHHLEQLFGPGVVVAEEVNEASKRKVAQEN